MSEAFDTNLLSQITALDRKLSIGKERVNLFTKPRHNDHRRQKSPSKDTPPGDTDGKNDTGGSPGGGEGKINIVI